MNYRIVYDAPYGGLYKGFPDDQSGLSIQPFFFDVFDQSDRKFCRAAFVRDDNMLMRLGDLTKETSEERVNEAVVRWALGCVEEALLAGMQPNNGALKFRLGDRELEMIARIAAAKTCRYQEVHNRELFCLAAAKDDPFIRGQSGTRWLAPTTRPVCAACELPDTDAICSHFMHPTLVGSATVTGYKRLLKEKYCDRQRDEIQNQPSRCNAGGHSCWERLVDSSLVPKSAVPYSPRGLPVELDFLNVVWELAFSGQRLIGMKSVESVTELALPCSTKDEFSARLSGLADLFKLMTVDDALLPPGKTFDKSATFDRLLSALGQNLPDYDVAGATSAVGVLRIINKVRAALQHSGATSRLYDALTELGISVPVRDYGEAWDSIRAKAAEAVSGLRKAIQAATS